MTKFRSEFSQSNCEESNTTSMCLDKGEEVVLEDVVGVLRLDDNTAEELVQKHESSSMYAGNLSEATFMPKTARSTLSVPKSLSEISMLTASWSVTRHSASNIGQEMVLDNALEVLKVKDYDEAESAKVTSFVQNNVVSHSKPETDHIERLQSALSVTKSKSGLSLSTMSRSSGFVIRAGDGRHIGLNKALQTSTFENGVATEQTARFSPVESDSDSILNPNEVCDEKLQQLHSTLSGLKSKSDAHIRQLLSHVKQTLEKKVMILMKIYKLRTMLSNHH